MLILQVPASIELATELKGLDFEAGGTIPETTANVLNGSGQKVTKGHVGGEKLTYTLCQRLWFCPTGV